MPGSGTGVPPVLVLPLLVRVPVPLADETLPAPVID